MAEEAAIMAHPDLRHPFEAREIDAGDGAIVLNGEAQVQLEHVHLGDDGALWINPADLPRINGFELKPEGACFEELCIPIPDDSALFRVEGDANWFNVTAFADWLEQTWVYNEATRVWSFGEIPAQRQSLLMNAEAPEFELLDRQGNVVRMSDYKGRKALIITWSSW